MPKTVILGTARTPFGKLGGGLSSLDATDLGGTAIEAALERAEVKPDEVQHVVFGQVLQAGQGQMPSRQAQIKGGIPKEVSSETVNKVCASGLRSVGMIDQAVRAGDLEVGVAGGMESMSQAPYLLPKARFGFRMGDVKALDAMTHDGLTNPFTDKAMAVEATEVGDELEMTRADLDKFALSQPRARDRRPPTRDASPRRSCRSPSSPRSPRTWSRSTRPPAARARSRRWPSCPGIAEQGGHPHRRQLAGCQRRRRGDRPLQRRVGQGQRQRGAGDDRGPGRGGRRLPLPRPHPGQRHQAGAREGRPDVDDIDLFEINEAFASVALNSMRMLGIDESKVNVNGGAIALGHPIGASGARILGALTHELRRRGGGLGVAAICSGGGQGDAVIIEVNGG